MGASHLAHVDGGERSDDMLSPQAVLIALAVALTIWVGEEIAVGIKKVTQLEKKAAHTVVHVLKKVVGKE